MNWLAFFQRFLPHLAPTLADKFGGMVRDLAGKEIAEQLAPTYARALVKGVDAVAAASARLISDPQDRIQAVTAYVRRVREEENELENAVEAYAPVALRVENAKEALRKAKPAGKPAAVAALAAARAERRAFKNEVSEEAREFFAALFGSDDDDD